MRTIFSAILICICFIFSANAQDAGDLNGATTVKRLVKVIDTGEKLNYAPNAGKSPFNEMLYALATEGYQGKKIVVYRDSACSKVISADDVLVKGRSEETITIYPDPERPDYQLDTTLVDMLQPSSIDRFLVKYDSLQTADNRPAYRIVSVAPLYSTSLAGVLLSEMPIFWAKWEDLTDLLKSVIYYGPQNVNGRLSVFDYFNNLLFSGSSNLEDIEMND